MKSFLCLLLSPLAHLDPIVKVIRTWMFEVKGASEQQATPVLVFLDEDYLCLVPLMWGVLRKWAFWL